MDFNKTKKLILSKLEHVDKSKKNRNHLVYTNDYYLDMMFLLIDDLNKWTILKSIDKYGEGKKKYPYHYKTIYNKYRQWSAYGIFEDVFNASCY